MVSSLPPELGLLILKNLSLHDIATIQRVSSAWRALVRDNSESIFVAAAQFHGYGDGGEDLCKKRRRIERSWTGHAPVQLNFRPLDNAATTFVHRFKIDDKNKFIICSHKHPGISVWDLETSALLWQRDEVELYAHVEYSNGFLVFNNEAGQEVWRHEPDFDGPPPVDQPYDSNRLGNRRGTFHPWAILTPPEDTRLFRLAYPTLLAASEQNLYLWDIPTARLTCTIHDFQGPHDDIGFTMYIDFNQEYIVVCGTEGVGVYKKPGIWQGHVEGSDCRILLLSAEDYPITKAAHHSVARGNQWQDNHLTVKPLTLKRGTDTPSYSSDEEFYAVHVDPNGTSLVVLLTHARLLFIPDLSVPNPTGRLKTFQLGPANSISKYLAFEYGRVAVATTRGIFIVHLPRRSPIDNRTLLSPIRASLVHSLTNRTTLRLVSCLQITENALWVNWNGGTNKKTWVFAGDSREDDDFDPMWFSYPSRVCRVNFDAQGMSANGRGSRG